MSDWYPEEDDWEPCVDREFWIALGLAVVGFAAGVTFLVIRWVR